MVLICPKCWCESVLDFAGEMQPLSNEEEGIRREGMSKAADMFAELPYVGLMKMRQHKFGSLRTWPKHKTVVKVFAVIAEMAEGKDAGELSEEMKEVWEKGWKAIRWRPLVWYAGHRWKGLFRMIGQFCNTTVKVLQLGFMESSARGALEKMHAFNDGRRTHGSLLERRRKLEKTPKEVLDRTRRVRYPRPLRFPLPCAWRHLGKSSLRHNSIPQSQVVYYQFYCSFLWLCCVVDLLRLSPAPAPNRFRTHPPFCLVCVVFLFFVL